MAAQDSSWAGWIAFAGIVLLIIGALDVLQGFTAIIKDEYVVSTPKGLATFDATGWGWTTLIWGILIFITGLGLLGGSDWARWLAIIKDEYVVSTPKGLATFDATGWGWTTLIWGILIFITGLGLLGGSDWARWLAIIGVGLNAIGQIGFLANYPQAYPLWNILIVALNILVLYALTARWQGYRAAVTS
jgi:hypothetical protein